ncbi:MAG TPA: DUF2934 domain-containing protein [Pirellulales bacterium]|nr:DUF2934 domain-containing protein [Pirellulales bacterium]
MKTTIRRTQREAIPTPAGVVTPGPKPEYSFPTHDMIARRAYEIWERHGCPRGTEFQDWLAAESELRSRH